jgi:hypothetical protein
LRNERARVLAEKITCSAEEVPSLEKRSLLRHENDLKEVSWQKLKTLVTPALLREGEDT